MELNEIEKLEAILLVEKEVSKKELVDRWEFNPVELSQHIELLKRNSRVYTVIETETSLRLVLTDAAGTYIKTRKELKHEKEIGSAGAEVLACIIYQGPLSKGSIDELRGVDSRSTINDLLQRGYLERTDKKYSITSDGLASLGITKREEAPDYEAISSELGQENASEDA